MKSLKTKYLFLLLFLVAIGGCLTSCSDGGDYVWDFVSAEIEIDIVDEEGRSLIEPMSRRGDLRLKSIVAKMGGQEYKYEGLSAGELRALPEFYRGLHVRRGKGGYRLVVGEFQPHYVREKIELIIPGVSAHTIEFTYSVTTAGKNAFMRKMLWVDGAPSGGDNPFEVKLVVDRAKWENVNLSAKEPDYLPVTLYFDPLAYHYGEELPASSITYRGRTYKCRDVRSLGGADPIYSKELLFYSGVSSFFAPDHSRMGGVYLAFGPFDPATPLTDEHLELTLEGRTYPISFSLALSDDGEVLFEAKIDDASVEDYYKKKLYFRNGPLIILPR